MNQTAQLLQKRQIIDCNQHQGKNQQEDGRRYQYQTYKNDQESQFEQLKQFNKLHNDPLGRVNLKPQSQTNLVIQNKLNVEYDDAFGIITPKLQSFKLQLHQDNNLELQQSEQDNHSRNQWIRNMNNNPNPILPQNEYFQAQLQSQNSYGSSNNLEKERLGTGSLQRPQKFQSLGNIEVQDTFQKNNSQEIIKKQNSHQDSNCKVSNKGRYLIHQKAKQTVESNQPPSTFFITPNHTMSKTPQYKLEEILLNKRSEDKISGIVYSNNIATKQNQYKINMKNDKIFASFVPCFSISSSNQSRQIPSINQYQQPMKIQKKSSSSQNQTRSSMNLEYRNEQNTNQICYPLRINQNLDFDKKKLLSSNEIQTKFDLLNNLFISNALVKGKTLNNDLIKYRTTNSGFGQSQKISKQQFDPNQKRNTNSTHEDQSYNEQYPLLNKNFLTMNQSNFIVKNYQNDKFGQISTETGTDQPDTSSSQDDANNKDQNIHKNMQGKNITNELIGNNDINEEAQKMEILKQNDNFIDKNKWNIMNSNTFETRQVPVIFGNKRGDQKLVSQDKNGQLQNKALIRLGSLSFLDEAENGKNPKKFMAASFTKLPSTCQLGKAFRKSMNTLSNIKSIQDISSLKDTFVVDEKKMNEDYRQFQLRNKLDIKAKSVAVYDQDNKTFILSIKGEKLSQMASLTKIMTCYIICDLLNKISFAKTDLVKVSLKSNQIVKISKIAAKMKGTSALLKSGDEITLWSLLHGLMLPSGNDAAFAISEHVGSIIYESSPLFKAQQYSNNNLQSCNPKQGQKEFIRVMNLYAEKMKLRNTTYSNPHGLSNNKNKSCANDLCILVSHAMKNSYFREIVKTQEHTAHLQNYSKGSRDIIWENTNKLLKNSKYCNGVKTGVTPAAGPCLASSFSINNRNFIIVVLKTPTMEMRFSESISIFKFIVEIYNLNKQNINKSEQLISDLNYEPNQNDIIEKKYIKKGWQLTSTNNIVSTNDIDEDKYSSDDEDIYDFDEEGEEDQDQEEEDEEEEGYSTNFANNANKNRNQDDEEDQDTDNDNEQEYNNNSKPIITIVNKNKYDNSINHSSNVIESSETFSGQNLSNQKIYNLKTPHSNSQANKFQELLQKAINSSEQIDSLNQKSIKQQQLYDEQNELKINEQNLHRQKKLSKINEEDS